MSDKKIFDGATLTKLVEVSGAQMQHIKLGPGVVGRTASMVWMFEAVMFAGVIAGAYEHNSWIIGGCVAAAFFGLAYALRLNHDFAKDNPIAAVTEGADFTLCQITQMGSKNKPVIEATNPIPPPKDLADASRPNLPEQSQ